METHAKCSLVVLRGVSPLNRKVANYTLKAFGCNWAYIKDNDSTLGEEMGGLEGRRKTFLTMEVNKIKCGQAMKEKDEKEWVA